MTELELKFRFSTLVKLEEALGRPISELNEGASLKDVQTMIYYGLKHGENEKITKVKAYDLIDDYIEEHGMTALTEKMSAAMQKATGSTDAMPTNG